MSLGSELCSRLSEVVVTNVTPFREDGSVNHESLAEHVTFLADRGIKVIVPGGNTGEFSSLSADELKAIYTTVVETVGNRVAVVAGVGWSSPIAIDLARYAQSVGIPAVLVHHPTHTYIDRVGLRRYYQAIMDSVDIGLVVYKRGPELTDELLAELSREDQVVGVKYAVNDVHAFARLVSSANGGTAWLCGSAERWAPFFHLAGAQGFTSGLANFAPHKALDLFRALQSCEFAEAMRMRNELAPFEELRQEGWSGKNVSAVKEAMAQMKLCERTVRDPLCSLADRDRQVVRDILVEWGLLAQHGVTPA